MKEEQDDETSDRDTMGGPITDQPTGASEGAMHDQQAHEARWSEALGSAAGFLELLAAVVEAERLVVAGLSKEMPCRKMHENRHRAFREALSMATAYFSAEPLRIGHPSPHPMKTENIIKAAQSFDLFMADVRAAHRDAIASGNRFAELAMMNLITEAAALNAKLANVKAAAGL